MKNCLGCKYAEWDRSKNGNLHPSGNGRCGFPYKVPQLPASMYWIMYEVPKPHGGFINRRESFAEHCPYYLRGENE
jgi:hypothetical protein